MADAVIGALRVVLGADSAAFEKQMKGIAANLDGIGRTMRLAGAGLTAGVTAPLVALGKMSLDAFQESEQAVAAVNAAIKSTGGAAGKTSQQLQDMAAKLQSISTYDDDQILSKVTANLLTFTNVSGEAFDRAQQAALDLSARLGQDLQSSTIQLGKALNDPIKGITALSRVGVTFTQTQKDMIKAMVQTGDIAGAQKVILDEVYKEFGGQAQAAAQTTAGAWAQMRNSLGDAMEAIGKNIAPFVVTFANFVKSVAEGFSNLDPTVQKFIIGIGAVAAAIGPALIAIGLIAPAITAIAPLVAPVIATLFGPAGLIIAGLAAVSIALDAFGIDFETQWDVVKIAFSGVLDFLKNQVAFFKALFTGDFAGAWDVLRKTVTDVLGTVAAIVERVFPGTIAKITEFINAVVGKFTAMKTGAIDAAMGLYIGVKQWLMDKLTAVFDYVSAKIEALTSTFAYLYDKVVGHSYIPDMVTESTAWLKKMGVAMDTIGGDAVAGWNANMAQMSTANATIGTMEAASVSGPANDNMTGSRMSAGGGIGGVTINLNATDYNSFAKSKGQLQSDLSDMVRAAFAGR